MSSWKQNVVAAALALLGPAGGCIAGEAEFQQPPDPPETKYRLPPEMMTEMVAEPMAALRAGGVAAGREAFEQLRRTAAARYGPESVRIADLHMAFGVELYMRSMITEDQELLRASRDYLHASIPAYRATFGTTHPDVALALNSYADVEIKLHGDRVTPQAEAALREALRIRLATLGPKNIETLATQDALATIDASKRGKRGAD